MDFPSHTLLYIRQGTTEDRFELLLSPYAHGSRSCPSNINRLDKLAFWTEMKSQISYLQKKLEGGAHASIYPVWRITINFGKWEMEGKSTHCHAHAHLHLHPACRSMDCLEMLASRPRYVSSAVPDHQNEYNEKLNVHPHIVASKLTLREISRSKK